MGSCGSSYEPKAPAYEHLTRIFSNIGQKAPLIFIIKEWPSKSNIDIRNDKLALNRTIEVSIYTGEMMQLTLKNHRAHQLEESQNLQRRSSLSVLKSINGLHCEIRKNNLYYQIDFPHEDERQFIWKYVKDWHELEEGSVFRIGTTRYKLSKIVGETTADFEQIQTDLQRIKSHSQITAPRCRICLSTIDTPQNPFISPCRCQGSIQFSHLRCLSAWMFSSSMSENNFLKVTVNKNICQLCKTDITHTPQYARMEKLLLTNLHEIEAPYGIFQCGNHQVEENTAKNYFVICFKRKSNYTFGRHRESDICDPSDIHSSKINSEIKYANDRVYIRDCQSMHGTLVQVKNIRIYQANPSEVIVYHNMIVKISFDPALQAKDIEFEPVLNPNSSTRL